MCLLVVQPATTKLSDKLLKGVYARNQDGIGVMYAEDGKLCFKKALPKNENEFVDFYRKNIEGRSCAWHARMQTHGAIDLENCHPYGVFGFDEGEGEVPVPTLLMHNGILSSGNWKDKSKSDTWHYIRDYLRPMLAGNPTFAFTPQFREIIGRHIGDGNRFVLMNAYGEVSVVNKSTGVEYAGAWFSNTYAWDAYSFMERKSWSKYPSWDSDDYRYDSYQRDRAPFNGKSTYVPASHISLAGATKNLPDYFADAPKSKNQLKREKKAAEREARRLAKLAATSPKLKLVDSGLQERLDDNGGDEVGAEFKANLDRQLIKVDHIDDVLELRSMLDGAYLDNTTKDTELQMLLETMGVTRTYLAMELLVTGKISRGMWDNMVMSPTRAKAFSTIDTTKWDDVPEGKFTYDQPATEKEVTLQ